MTTDAPFYLFQFGSTAIPGYQGTFNKSAAVQPTTLRTLGGSFDGAGSGVALPVLPYPLTYTGLVVHATDTTQVRIGLDALSALRGKIDRLWLHTADGDHRWAWARLMNVSPDMKVTDRAAVQFVLTFEVRSIWNGTAHSGGLTDTGYLFANGLYLDATGAEALTSATNNIVITNGGNVAVDNCGIVIVAATSNITALTVGITNICEFTFSAPIVVGTNLIIDCGSKTVLNVGVGAYQYLARTANHHIEPWLRLAAGANTVRLTIAGGTTDSSVRFVFSDGWA